MAPTAGEISKILGIPEKAVHSRAKKESWASSSTNGELDYKTFLLPKDVRKKIETALKAVVKKEPVSVPEPEPTPTPEPEQMQSVEPAPEQMQSVEPAPEQMQSVEPAPEPEKPVKQASDHIADISEMVEQPVEPVKPTAENLPAIIEVEPVPPVEQVKPLENPPARILHEVAVRKASQIREIVNLPEDVKEIGLLRYNLGKKWREHVATAEWGKGMESSESFMVAYNGGHLLPGIYARLGAVAESTVRAWDKKLRQSADDYVCLCDGRAVRQTCTICERSLSNAERTAFLNCYLDPRRPTVTISYRAARLILLKDGIQETASEKTYRRWLKDYAGKHEGIICYAREGEKAWKDKYGTYITRDLSLLKPCQCLVADGKTLNFQILHPDTGNPCRMTLILFEDMATRCPVGWQIMPTEDTIAIHAAFRNAVVNIGRYPEVVYLDNGRAFKSKHFTDKEPDLDSFKQLFSKTNPDFEEFRGLYARVGVTVVHATPYNGKAKIVERFFRIFQEQCECLLPSFCGDSISTKPAWMHRNEKWHREQHKAKTNNWIPSIREASAIIEAYFKWYAEEPTDLLGGKSPLAALAEGCGPGIPIEQLNWDFMWRKAITPRNGRIRHWKIDYEADFLINLSRSQPIMCLYETSDVRTMYCYTMEGNYLGEAYPVQALHPLAAIFGDEFSARQVKNLIAQQKRQLKSAKQQLLDIGAGQDMADGLEALPYNQMVPITVSTVENQAAEVRLLEEKLPEDEIIRLEDFMARQVKQAEIEEREPCTIPRPEYWKGDLEHYEWAFAVLHEHGQHLSAEDEAFMKYFEMTEEFRNNYQGRFEDLKLLYGT